MSTELEKRVRAFDAQHLTDVEKLAGYEIAPAAEEALFAAFHLATKAGWKPTTEQLWEETTGQAAPTDQEASA